MQKKFLLLPLAALIAGAALGAAGFYFWQTKSDADVPSEGNTAKERKVLYWYNPMKPDAHFDKPGPSPFMDMDLVPMYASEEPAVPVKKEKKVLYWYDPMKPDAHFDKPGPSPFMDMDLVPMYAEETATPDEVPAVRVSAAQQQNLGLHTTAVKAGKLTVKTSAAAVVTYNEHEFSVVQARAAGYVRRIYPTTVGDFVQKGQPLAEITIAAWAEAQAEYLALKRVNAGTRELDGVLTRLRLAGMDEADIALLKRTGKIKTDFTVTAPASGIVTALDVRRGMNVTTDAKIAEIQGTDPVWVTASVPESFAPHLTHARAQVEISALPGVKADVIRSVVLPAADDATRTVRVRFLVSNPQGAIRPGFSARVTFTAETENTLLIPSRAVIDTGSTKRVIVADGSRFIPRMIETAASSAGMTSVTAGLAAGEKVVTDGLFLIDSEANISGVLKRMQADAATDTAKGAHHD